MTEIPPPWPHQVAGVEWVNERGGSYLHLPMGAGKSRIIVDAADRVEAKDVLIVCPKAAVDSVWPKQFEEFSPRDWKVIPWTRLPGTATRRVAVARTERLRAMTYDRPVVTVVNYDALLSQALHGALHNQVFDMIVFDEAHKLKSPNGKISKRAAALRGRSKRVVGLSGTPMPHSPMDVWAQMRAINPELFGRSFWKFRNEYAVMGGYKDKKIVSFQNMPRLQGRLAERMYSPPPEEVKLDLPEARHVRITVDLSPKARKLYDALKSDVVAELDEGTITYKNGLVKLLRMQQLGSGLAVVDAAPPDMSTEESRVQAIRDVILGKVKDKEMVVVDTAKRDALVDLIDGTDEPIVVFGQFRRDVDMTHEAAGIAGATVGELSGKANNLMAWQRGDTRVLAVQIDSGAEAVDFTRARICVYLSTGFNLGTYLQSVKRIHRPGQKRAVVYYHIHARDSIDQIVWRVLEKREDLVEGVLAGIRDSAENFA